VTSTISPNLRNIFAIIAGASFLLFQSTKITSAATDPSDDQTSRLEKLERAVASLQEENKSLKKEVSALKHQPSAPQTAHPANPAVTHAATGTSSSTNSVAVAPDFKGGPPLELTNNGFVTSDPGKSPLAIQIGSLTLTPLGFMDFTSVTRGTLNGGDIGTSFASFPYSNTAAGQLSETRYSVKNSRLGLRMDTDISDTKVLGYVETDFLGNAPTNLNVASNSDTLRMRVYFVDVQHGPWEFLAGQDWSMLTPNRKGISPLPNDVFYTQDVDVNYQVGLVWERTPQLRLLYHVDDHLTLGFSAENPDQYVGSAVLLPANFTATQVDNGSNGTTTPNFMPDLVGKVAYDTKIAGLPFHADAAGIFREYKINTFLPAKNTSSDAWANGFGGSINMNIGIFPHFQLIENLFAGDGVGREISTGVAPDFIVSGPDANGVDHIRTVDSYAGIIGAEWDVLPVTKLFGYYGQTHIGREYDQLANGSFVGYGYPGSPNTNNKRIQEYTIGLSQVLWKSDRYGDLKLLLQYSYLERDPWFIPAGGQRDAHMHMGYVDIRYDLP
jgi:hypothetical protein